MAILVFDTTGAECSVALRIEGHPDRVLSETIGRGHAERLAPMAQQVMDQAGLAPSALQRIGVTIGPGGFAGTRVGVAFARGLALSSGAKAYGISNLAVTAHSLSQARPLATVHDAKRGEVVIQIWRDGAGEAQRLSIEEAADRVSGIYLAGGGARLVADDGQRILDEGKLDLVALLDLSERAGEAQSPPTPFYVRPPDAKLPGGIDP